MRLSALQRVLSSAIPRSPWARRQPMSWLRVRLSKCRLPALADKGYTGAGIGIHTPAKGAHLAPSTATRNRLLTRLRAEGERGIALLKTRWKALRRIRLCPQRIGAVT